MRAKVVVAVAAAMALSLAGVASAAGPGRLAGTFKVKIKITQVQNIAGQRAGRHRRGEMEIHSELCDRRLRHGPAAPYARRKVVIEKLSVAASNYREKWVQQTDCFDDKTGKLILRKAYKLTYVLKGSPDQRGQRRRDSVHRHRQDDLHGDGPSEGQGLRSGQRDLDGAQRRLVRAQSVG